MRPERLKKAFAMEMCIRDSLWRGGVEIEDCGVSIGSLLLRERREGHQARWAGSGLADLALGQLMEQRFPGLAAGVRFENLAAELAETFKPGGKVAGQLLVDFAAEALGDGGTFSGGGDGDLQGSAADHRTEKEIAVGNVVDAVAKNVSLDRAAING